MRTVLIIVKYYKPNYQSILSLLSGDKTGKSYILTLVLTPSVLCLACSVEPLPLSCWGENLNLNCEHLSAKHAIIGTVSKNTKYHRCFSKCWNAQIWTNLIFGSSGKLNPNRTYFGNSSLFLALPILSRFGLARARWG